MTGRAWHRDAVTPSTEAALQALSDAGTPPGTYLAGGTGLALQFGHRRSLDLDFFVPGLFDEEALLRTLQSLPAFALVSRAPHTLHLALGETKVSYLGHQYPTLHPTSLFLEVEVADPRDIACMKISAIASRGTKRGFIDFHAACLEFSLRGLLAIFARKYEQANYSRLHVLKSLMYFADAEKDPMPHMLRRLEWEEVKRYFRREIPVLF